MRVLSGYMRAAKLAKLIEIEGFEDENALYSASMSDSVCPAICCNPDNPACDYTAEMEPDQDRGWCGARSASAGRLCLGSFWVVLCETRSSGASSEPLGRCPRASSVGCAIPWLKVEGTFCLIQFSKE